MEKTYLVKIKKRDEPTIEYHVVAKDEGDAIKKVVDSGEQESFIISVELESVLIKIR